MKFLTDGAFRLSTFWLLILWYSSFIWLAFFTLRLLVTQFIRAVTGEILNYLFFFLSSYFHKDEEFYASCERTKMWQHWFCIASGDNQLFWIRWDYVFQFIVLITFNPSYHLLGPWCHFLCDPCFILRPAEKQVNWAVNIYISEVSNVLKFGI